jgi:hypothetical protein
MPWRECFPIHEIGRIDGGRGFRTGKNVFRIGGNTFYDRKNKIPMKISELKRSGIGLIAEFHGTPNRFPNQGDWAMIKCCHKLFGWHFVWVIDYYAVKFILLYGGANPTILFLQMCLMGWDVHQNDHCITAVKYWSHLGTNLCFNPLFKAYLNLMCTLCLKNSPSMSVPIKPENMPYYCRPQVLPANNSD